MTSWPFNGVNGGEFAIVAGAVCSEWWLSSKKSLALVLLIAPLQNLKHRLQQTWRIDTRWFGPLMDHCTVIE